MVAIEPTKLPPQWEDKIKTYAENSTFYADLPKSNEEIIHRIGDADCVLISYTSRLDKEVLEVCPNIQYIGMCCSLYAPESANVDVLYARDHNIVVTGASDYGDNGVREYVVSELVQLLQGRGKHMWKSEPMELTNVPIGIVGMGTVGSIIAETLHFFGANIHYYSRTRKLDLESRYNYTYMPLDTLLRNTEILITCLTKNTVLLGNREFELFGSGKILMNVSIAPSHDISALRDWLEKDGNYAFSDSLTGLGPELAGLERANYGGQCSGLTSLAKERLAQIVLSNIKSFLS